MGCNTVVVEVRGKTVVKVAGVKTVPVILGPNTVAKIDANRPRAVVLKQPTPVTVVEQPTNVNVGGMGIQGRPGAPGGSIPTIDFAWGDAPHIVWTPDNAGVLTLVRIDIVTPFNGASPSIVVGTLSDPTAAMPADQNDPKSIAKYQRTADIHLIAGQGVLLTITPGAGASAGAGVLILEFLPD